MAVSVVMPALELMQESGKLVSWRRREGDAVSKGEPLLEIETDKAVVEIEAPADGILTAIKAEIGAVIPVGQTIAWIVAPGEQPPVEAAAAAVTKPQKSEPALPCPVEPAAEHSKSARARVSPKVRRIAHERGIDLGNVRGSGPEGEVLADDVLTFSQPASGASSATGATGAVAIEKLSSVARLMAERTTQSWTTAPHFFAVRDIEASRLVALREERLADVERSHGVRLTHTDLIVALAARVLRRHPRVNASWTVGGIRDNPEINIGVAIAVNDGVVSAVIHDAGRLELGQIAAQRRDLSRRAKEGHLRPLDISGGTFTISNLGMYQVDAFSAIITPPQAAVLAVGRIAERVVPVDGKPAIRPIITVTLSSDHRVLDGARAALFLKDLAEAIHSPEKELL